jgi:hypothetical protein
MMPRRAGRCWNPCWGADTQTFDEDYRKLKAGQPHELDEDSVEAYHDMLETLSGDMPARLCQNSVLQVFKRPRLLQKQA